MTSSQPQATTPSAMQSHFRDTTAFSASSTLSPSSQPFLNTPVDSPGLMPPYDKPPPIRRVATLDSRAVPAVIPPEHESRTLVLCFDGTGDQFDADNSNIVQLVSLLKKDDRTKQLVYYQAGIGTYTSVKYATPFMSKIRKTLDEMFAWNLNSHVMSGYEFLMQNYITGDKICIFGFSRGAYTARSLAGMLHKVGLLPAGNYQQVPFAYKMYTRNDHIGWEMSNEFKKAFCVDVGIEFVGVWDTVDSVGIFPKRLPFTTSNTIVRTFRHAIALDERRAKFKTNLWNRPNKEEAKLGMGLVPPGTAAPPVTTAGVETPGTSGSASDHDNKVEQESPVPSRTPTPTTPSPATEARSNAVNLNDNSGNKTLRLTTPDWAKDLVIELDDEHIEEPSFMDKFGKNAGGRYGEKERKGTGGAGGSGSGKSTASANGKGVHTNGRSANGKKRTLAKESESDKIQNTLERMFSENGGVHAVKETDVEEVWFAGCHCDVGGGAVSNKTRHSLARITLRWMVRECFKAKTGIMFNSDALRTIGMDPSTVYPFVVPRPPPIPVKPTESDAPSPTLSMDKGAVSPTDEKGGVGAIDKKEDRVFRIQNPPKNPIPIRPHHYLSKFNPKFKIKNKGGIPSPSPSSPALAGTAGAAATVEEEKKKKKKEELSVAELLREHAAHCANVHTPTPFLGSEEEEEVRDAMSPKYDQLNIVKGWWVLEILPLQLRYQRGDNVWVTKFKSNMASPRFIPKQRTNGFKVHRSVKMRMEAEYEDAKRRAKGKQYVPKPVWRVEPTWID